MNEEQKFPMMSMRRITKLPYIESGGEGMLHGGGYGNEYGGYKSKQKEKAAKVYVPPEAGFGVSRSLGNKQSDIENQPTYYGALKEHMREMGPENVAPIHVQPRGKVPAYGGGGPLEHANLGNGGHRVAIAMELGWTHMRTTSEKGASGYAEEDEYGKGEGGEDSDAYYNEQSSADIDSNPYPGVAGKEGEFGGAYVQGGRGRRAQPTGGTGGPREWAHPPNSARDNVKQKAWGTGPIQEQNARIQGYGGGQRSDRRPGDGQQELKLPRPVPDPYVSEQQFGAVKHKSLTSAIAAGDRAGELARYKRIHAADERP
jgi:hypothetical protein